MTDSVVDTRLPLLPLDLGVVLPGVVVTLPVSGDLALAAVRLARRSAGRVVLAPVVGGRYARVGVVAAVENAGELPDGTNAVIVRTLGRAVIGSGEADASGALLVGVEEIGDAPPGERAQELARELRAVLEGIASIRNSRRLPEILRTVQAPGALADAATSWSEASVEHKLAVLEALDVEARVTLVLEWARAELRELELSQRIRDDVAEGMERQQREYLLRQQMAAIRKELGEDSDDNGDSYRTKLDELGPAMPENVRTFVEREISRLERTGAESPEQSWIRTWLDRIFELPWGVTTPDQLELDRARAVLDADHTGLDDVKQRIVEHLAVRRLRALRGLDGTAPQRDESEADSEHKVPASKTQAGRRGQGAVLCLVGPPGVGKTSLGESVARAMGRRFVRVALGGVRDEAEVRGHRRTYVGAQPGRIARAIAEAGSWNPVMLLDEVDKVGSDWRGDPSSALLEVLDPAQNHTFRDHYLEVDLDLSGVLFLATANVIDTIPGPLLDRMELVRLDGYTEEEKVAIARAHLLPRLLREVGLEADEVVIDNDAIRRVVVDYTREAGVRSLERELARLLRKLATKIAAGDPTPVQVGAGDVRSHLGRARFHDEAAERVTRPGVATGLAVTGIGGDVLFVEASASSGESALVLTGQLGDVMKESAQIALSYVRAHADELGIEPTQLEQRFHVHVPAGAVPKDGPSAGVTLTTALVSLLTGVTVRPDVGMTGEVTLQGRVLPIGGVKQKVLAAHRAGLTSVILPEGNEPDLEDVPEAVRTKMDIRLAHDIDDVLAFALQRVHSDPNEPSEPNRADAAA